jgi:subtilisin family serine protease
MREKYIVLRTDLGPTRDMFRGPVVGRASVDPVLGRVDVDVDEIERSRVPALTRNADVAAVAPAIPMQLIAPVSAAGAREPVVDGAGWGVRAVRAHATQLSGDGVVVGILDTGIDAGHPAFVGMEEIVQEDFTGEGSLDRDGHGTHCAGTIFGRTTGGTRIGVAPGVRRALIGKVIGSKGGSSDQIVRAILWAVENGAHVISMSLGMDFPGFRKQLAAAGFPEELATSRALEAYRLNVQLFERLASLIRTPAYSSQTAVVVAAAGNESQRDVRPDFEIAVSPPAVAEGIISVAAVGRTEQGLVVAPFSNTGANVSGPGVDIISAKPGGGFATMSGTSMATPHVAGVAALWAEKLIKSGRLNLLELTSRIVGSATHETFKAGFDPFDVGAGLVHAP